MANSNILPGTSIAAVYGQDPQSYPTTSSLRVYTQDIDGNIRESRHYESGWSASGPIVKAKLYSPIAAINMGRSIRLYFLDDDNTIQEIYMSDREYAWTAGSLGSLGFKASPASRLTICSHVGFDDYYILYYQQPDGAIAWNMWIGYWSGPPALIQAPKAFIGTGVAALAVYKGSLSDRLYYRLPDGTLSEAGAIGDDAWSCQEGLSKITSVAPTSDLVVITNTFDDPSPKLYFLSKTNATVEYRYERGEWQGPNFPSQTPSSPLSGIAVVRVSGPNDLRLYIQDQSNQIQEYVLSGGQWDKGSVIPTQ